MISYVDAVLIQKNKKGRSLRLSLDAISKVEKNPAKAVECLTNAAEQGHEEQGWGSMIM